jgi:cation diffusion facilitator CzcD-associated flavoprotein CzcO
MDSTEIRRKYAEERDKRLAARPGRASIPAETVFDDILHDPYTPPLVRPAVDEEMDVLVVGAGFSALVAAAKLRQAGVSDVRLIDRAGDVGGVWYWNRYPGAMCDTAAMIYLPMLEATSTVPSAKYVPGYEIHQHALNLANTFGLRDNAYFQTNVTGMAWNDQTGRWDVTTDRGDHLHARFVLLGTGPIARAKLPDIPGIATFQGRSFHTSRWDYDYTGGDRTGAPMTGLADQRVGIIGTGATAIQVIPFVGRSAGETFIFQRTPSSIDVRNNQPIDPAWYAGLEPGWQDAWLLNFATLQTGGFTDEDLVQDGWTDIAVRIRDRVVQLVIERGVLDEAIQREAYEASDDEKMEAIRARVDAVVRDPQTANALKPWYRQLCKRPCFSDTYLDTYNLPSVHLIDTDGQGVERVDETGVWVNGTHYELDCIVWASGFEVGNEQASADSFPILGRDQVPLADAWAEGILSLHGIHAPGFPNLLTIAFAQGANLFSNIPHNFVSSGETIAQVVAHALTTGATIVEPTEEAVAHWVHLFETGKESFFGNPECTPGYYNNEGQSMTPKDRRNTNSYPGGTVAFLEYIDQWRRSGTFAGLTFRRV